MTTNKTLSKGVGIWEHFTVQDGLPDMKIECLYEDRQHQLWIGTHDRGLVRYTGDGFEQFTRREGLAGDGVFSVLEDRAGRLWIGTNGGLCCMEGEHIEQIGSLEGRGLLWGSCEDGTGALWFGLDGQPGQMPALCCWREGRLEVVELPGGPKERGEGVNQVVADGEGGFWCCGNELYQYSNDSFVKVNEFGLEERYLVDLVVQPSGKLWLVTTEGLYSYGKSGLNLITPVEGSDWIVALRQCNDGFIWAGMRDGRLMVYEDELPIEVGRIEGLMGRGMCIDHRGRVWLGTYGMGVFCYDATRFGSFKKKQGMPDDQVHCVLSDTKGRIWMGTRRGLVYFDGSQIMEPQGFDYIAQREITSIMESRSGSLYFGTRNGILVSYDEKCKEHKDLNIDEAEGYSITEIIEDNKNNIWFGFRVGYGFGFWDGEHLKYWGPQEQAPYPFFIGAMVVSANGSILFGSGVPTIWSGLCSFDGDGFEKVDDLQNRPVLALCQDSRNRLWIGTNEGVLCLDGESVFQLRQEDGLPCELVTVLQEGENGTIWIGTEGGGVCWYDGKVLQIIQIPREPGLNVIRGIVQNTKGQIWCATEGGLLRYSPERVKPTVLLLDVVAGRTYNANEKVQFPTTVGRIDFSFRGSTPIEASCYLVYRYRLIGFHDSWQQTNLKKVDYPKLDPGEYSFEVQAVDRDGNYSDPATVTFQVTEDPMIAGFNEVLSKGDNGFKIIGDSKIILEVKQMIQEVAKTDLSVLILGETGTGKGLVARAIHEFSNRRDKPFIPVNCGALTELVDSELFGHERGAFTGAIARRLGRFELADGGTIFLDEIGDMPIKAQLRLLRVLQEKVIERVGGSQSINVNVRIVAATNRDIGQAVRDGKFRQDLFYRLHVYPLKLPALRERKEDIPQLVECFVRDFARHLNLPQPNIPSKLMETFLENDWLGNVRELEYAVQRAVLSLQNSKIKHMEMDIIPEENYKTTVDKTLEIVPYEEFEKDYLRRVLEYTNGQIHGDKGAAKLLKLKPTTLRSRLKKLGIPMGFAFRKGKT